MIVVVDYDPAWPAVFAALRGRYETALQDVPVVAIEHVGSTSVEGLAAKPVIDVDIVVRSEDVAAASACLEAIGYVPLGEQGIAQRWAFRAPPDAPRTNTYVVVEGSLALRNHLGVRDVLRRDEELRREYADLKRRLSVDIDDIDAYVVAKSAVLERILAQAGLDDAERAEIESANRAAAARAEVPPSL